MARSMAAYDSLKFSAAGVVIGAANMRHQEVIFDRAGRRLAFVPSDCRAMGEGHALSSLEGGYGACSGIPGTCMG